MRIRRVDGDSRLLVLMRLNPFLPRRVGPPPPPLLAIFPGWLFQIEYYKPLDEFYLCDLGSLNGTYVQMVSCRGFDLPLRSFPPPPTPPPPFPPARPLW